MKPNGGKIVMSLIVLAVAALLAGCGGGSGTVAPSTGAVENSGSTSSTPTSTVASDPAAVARAVIALVQNGDCRARIYNGDPGALTAYGELKVSLEANRTLAIRRLTDKMLRQVADYC